jgi:small subunit ribosomal protein S6
MEAGNHNIPMNTYETIFICPADLTQEKVETTVEKVKSVIARANGKISSAEFWGRRRLSYPVKRNREGYYVYMVFTSPPEAITAIGHHYRVTDTILRGLTLKIDPRHLEKMRLAAKTAASAEAAAPAEQSAVPAPAAPASESTPLVQAHPAEDASQDIRESAPQTVEKQVP